MKRDNKFLLFVGSMMSGKTSRMLMTLERYKYQNKKIIAFKPKIDDRYHETNITSHMGWSYPAIPVENGLDILKYLSNADEIYDVIAIDELFMIDGGADALISLFQFGLTIVCSTLELSSFGKPFIEVQKIMPYATQIEKCAAVCLICGKDALYSHRKTEDNEEIAIGGADKYEPRCFDHFAPMNHMDD